MNDNYFDDDDIDKDDDDDIDKDDDAVEEDDIYIL